MKRVVNKSAELFTVRSLLSLSLSLSSGLNSRTRTLFILFQRVSRRD